MGTGGAPDPYAKKLGPNTPDDQRPGPTLAGFLDDSDRPDYKRLYLTADGSSCVEFPAEDVAAFTDIPPDQSPFLGEQATLVRLRPNVRVEYTYKRVFTTDEFDLHPRLTDVFEGDEFAPEYYRADCPRTYGTWRCTYRHTCQ